MVLTSTRDRRNCADGLKAGAKSLFKSKFARGLVNESVMAHSAGDVAYGNPAKALLDEGIATPKKTGRT